MTILVNVYTFLWINILSHSRNKFWTFSQVFKLRLFRLILVKFLKIFCLFLSLFTSHHQPSSHPTIRAVSEMSGGPSRDIVDLCTQFLMTSSPHRLSF